MRTYRRYMLIEPSVHTHRRLPHTAIVHELDVQVPDHVVLRNRKRLQRTVERASRRRDLLLLHQKAAVRQPNLRHLVHVQQCLVEIVVHLRIQLVRYHTVLALPNTPPPQPTCRRRSSK